VRRGNVLSTCCFLLLCSCSKVIVEAYNPRTYSEGIRFYRPQPYALVSEGLDDKGKPSGSNTVQNHLLARS
jgi:hypothetical protein